MRQKHIYLTIAIAWLAAAMIAMLIQWFRVDHIVYDGAAYGISNLDAFVRNIGVALTISHRAISACTSLFVGVIVSVRMREKVKDKEKE